MCVCPYVSRYFSAAYAWSHSSGLTIPGRIVLNLWRLMRDELKLCSYSFENCAAHILQRRFPSFPSFVKSRWFRCGIRHRGGACGQVHDSDSSPVDTTPLYSGNGMYRLLTHYMERCIANIEIVDRLDLIGRTAEVTLLTKQYIRTIYYLRCILISCYIALYLFSVIPACSSVWN
jgi:DNA polymerase zeta